MDSLSTTPTLSADLSTYVADLAARVDRLEQSTRQPPLDYHGHSPPYREHTHYGSVPSPHYYGEHRHSPHPSEEYRRSAAFIGKHEHTATVYSP